jgi:beta-galactosidase
MLMKIDGGYDRLEWYGDGPEETYVDRNRGAKLGIYRSSIADQMTPYIRPQEAGNHTGVRWAKVTDEAGHGLLFSSECGMEFSALPYTPYEMENAGHPNELPAPLFTVIRPALMRMGVGGDNAWGAKTHPEYRLPTQGKQMFTFYFKGI